MIGVESLEGEENPVEQLLSTTPSPAEQVDSYLPLPMLKDYRQYRLNDSFDVPVYRRKIPSFQFIANNANHQK